MSNDVIERETQSFVHDDFDPSVWDEINPYVDDLLNRKISCSKCIEGIIRDASELSEHISEKGALLYLSLIHI